MYICQGEIANKNVANKATRRSNIALKGKYNNGNVRTPKIQGNILRETAFTPRAPIAMLVMEKKGCTFVYPSILRVFSKVWSSSMK
jgi:hypothetical protein